MPKGFLVILSLNPSTGKAREEVGGGGDDWEGWEGVDEGWEGLMEGDEGDFLKSQKSPPTKREMTITIKIIRHISLSSQKIQQLPNTKSKNDKIKSNEN